MLQLDQMRGLMQESSFYPEYRFFEELDSTNTYLKREALSGLPEGTVVFCERQSAGRGRMGRSFFSPSGGGIYFSLLLRPQLPVEDTAMITACAAVCVCQGVQQVTGLHPEIKWVNDPQLSGKKFCGILTESVIASSKAPAFLVLGIGVNVNSDPSTFPMEVRERATSLRAQLGEAVSREAVSAAILDGIARFYRGFPQNVPEMAEAYRSRLATLGQEVTILGDESGKVYRCEDIDERFGLVVSHNGERHILRSGEVSVRAV